MSEEPTPAGEYEVRIDNVDDTVPGAGSGTPPVVGLGGSAGAIPALLRLLQNAPADGGVAYIVVLHMPDDHESVLDEVLQRATKMPVLRVDDTRPLTPDT